MGYDEGTYCTWVMMGGPTVRGSGKKQRNKQRQTLDDDFCDLFFLAATFFLCCWFTT